MPGFTEQKVLQISDKVFAKVFSTTANGKDSHALLIRCDELLVNYFGGDWRNLLDIFRQRICMDSQKCNESERDGSSVNFISLLPWEHWRILTELETELYWKHIPAQPIQAVRTHATAQDWSALQRDPFFFNVFDGDYPLKFVRYSAESS